MCNLATLKEHDEHVRYTLRILKETLPPWLWRCVAASLSDVQAMPSDLVPNASPLRGAR